MPSRTQLVQDIINIEWDMFSNVHNTGGKASCQNDKDDFVIMRKSQFSIWGDDTLASYLADLVKAQQDRRNLMSEKYGFMMESTFPDEFEAIEDQLPKAAPETMQLIEDIVNQHVVWKEELDSRYPVLGSLGRAARSAGDRMGMPSLETYMRAELKTYSPATVTLVHRDTIQHRSQGQNDAMATLLAQVQQYGFSSLEEAEEHQEKLV